MYVALFRSEAAAPTRINLATLILRLSLAVVFLFHGINKIVYRDGGASWVTHMYEGAPISPETKPEAERRQVPEIPASLSFMGTQLAVSWGEFVGGLALAIGMLTRLAALGLIIIQVGAVFLVTAPRGFSFTSGGYEYNLALIAMCLALFILGAGRWSLDWMLVEKRARKALYTTTSVPASETRSAPSGSPQQVAPGASQLS